MLNWGSTGHISSWSCFMSQNPRIVGLGSDPWRCPRAGDTGTHPRGFGMTPEGESEFCPPWAAVPWKEVLPRAEVELL